MTAAELARRVREGDIDAVTRDQLRLMAEYVGVLENLVTRKVRELNERDRMLREMRDDSRSRRTFRLDH